MKTRTIIISGIITSLFTPFVMSGEPDALVDIEPTPAHKSWQFEVASLAFLSGIDGTVGVGEHSADFDFKFGDLFEQLDAAVIFAASATYEEKFSLLAEFQYIGVTAEGSPRGPRYDHAEVEIDQMFLTVLGAYRVFDWEEGFVEIGGGFRYMWVESKGKLRDSSGVNSTLKSDSKTNNFDALAVVRMNQQLTPKLGLRFYGDVGAGDSDLTWQVYGGLGYAIREHTTVFVGYRHLAYELSDGNASLDIAFSGPQVGMVIRF